MLKRFEVHNFKCFRDSLIFDLGKIGEYNYNQDCINDGIISKGIIYGRNATGKTNLGMAIQDICYTLGGVRIIGHDNKLNADSDCEYSYFRYDFKFDNGGIIYEYNKNEKDEIIFEKVSLADSVLFELDFAKKEFVELNLELIQAESIRVDKFLASVERTEVDSDNGVIRLPFLRFLLNNAAISNDSLLRKLEEFVLRMSLISVKGQVSRAIYGRGRWLMSQLDHLSEDDNLREFEDFLNRAGIDLKLDIRKLPDGSVELYAIHQNRLVPFLETASSGTLALTDLFFRLVMIDRKMSFIYMDEFDAFYHYEMSEYIVEYFKSKYPWTQVILTTHNTNLMSNHIMRPDCLFILSRQGKITALCDATERELREGHNLEKLYIGGEFEKYE